MAFSATDGTTRILPFPADWFAAACSPSVLFYSLPVSRKLVLAGVPTNNVSFQSSCNASEFVVFDLSGGSVSALSAPAPFSANGIGQPVKEFVIAPNSIGQSPGDTLVVFDGLGNSVFTIVVPDGVGAFAGVAAVPALGLAVAVGINQQPGDGGLVLFDLVNAVSTSVAVPLGFNSVEFEGAFPATRKLVARAVKPNNTGSQFLIYDLITSNINLVPNPAGVVFVGAGPAPSAPGPGGSGTTIGGPGTVSFGAPPVVHANLNTNSVEALCFDANGNQTGLMSFRVP